MLVCLTKVGTFVVVQSFGVLMDNVGCNLVQESPVV